MHENSTSNFLPLRLLTCTNREPPALCSQAGADLLDTGFEDSLRVLVCSRCNWPIYACEGVVYTDRADMPDHHQPAFEHTPALPFNNHTDVPSSPMLADGVQAGFDFRSSQWALNATSFQELRGNSNRLKTIVEHLLTEGLTNQYITVADFGCGTGGLLAKMLKWHGRGQFVGVDLSPGMLQAAHQRLSQMAQSTGSAQLALIASPAERTPLRSEEFDLVTAELLLHHVSSAEDVIAEMGRLLGPGGTLVLQVPGPGYTLDANIGNGWRPGSAGEYTPGGADPLGRFSAAELRGPIVQSGLEVTQISSDYWQYRFESASDFLAFMSRTGADAQTLGYPPHGDLTTIYGHLFESRPLVVRGEFLTVTASKESR